MLTLSEVGNGTTFCEPHTGACSITNLTMKDLNQMEEEQDKMRQNFQALRNENLQLCKEKEGLMAECVALKEESQALKLECEQLKVHSVISTV